jgi:hypothetical protein
MSSNGKVFTALRQLYNFSSNIESFVLGRLVTILAEQRNTYKVLVGRLI